MSTLAEIKQVIGRAVPVPGDDVDTDRVIPARFMKCITFDGLGEYAFYDVRKNEDGTNKEHPLNEERYQGATIMIVGSNFGCGSSREHAPQSLYRYGIRGIIGGSFAEIFFGNCTTLGIPCVVASAETLQALTEIVEADASLSITIDVEAQVVRAGEQEFPVTVAASARDGLLKGEWDPIALMLREPEAIDAVAEKLGY